MQLRQTVVLRVENDHHAGVGYVYADFDYRRRNENVELAAHKARHDVFFLATRKTSVQQTETERGKDVAAEPLELGDRAGQLCFAFFDGRRNDVGLMAELDVAGDELVDATQPAFRTANVSIGVRPGGNSSMIERSRSA